jgi:hypothetical protein
MRRYSPATSSHPIVPRAHWTPSPCGRLSRPPRWGVTPTTTTGPPPRPGGNGGRCACPIPLAGSGGTAGALPTFTHTPVGRVGAQLYPRGIAARHRNAARGLAARDRRADETVLSEYEDRAPRQPIAASFGAGDEYRGFNHWYLHHVSPSCGEVVALRRADASARADQRSPECFVQQPPSKAGASARAPSPAPCICGIDAASVTYGCLLVDDSERGVAAVHQSGLSQGRAR